MDKIKLPPDQKSLAETGMDAGGRLQNDQAPAATGKIADKARSDACMSPVKARIFETACDLFYRQGIYSVGVDTIAAEAGSNKMSLYRCFGSKDELVAEYLRAQEQLYWVWWDTAIAPYAGNPRRQLEALFEAYVKKAREKKSTFGCAMANAAVEIREENHPASAVIRAYKAEIRRRLRELAAAIPVIDAESLGDALTLLLEGGMASSLTFSGGAGPVDHVDQAAKRLISSFASVSF